jgi:hypothetical protein
MSWADMVLAPSVCRSIQMGAIRTGSHPACGRAVPAFFTVLSEEHNWHEHFELLMKHPVINAGV